MPPCQARARGEEAAAGGGGHRRRARRHRCRSGLWPLGKRTRSRRRSIFTLPSRSEGQLNKATGRQGRSRSCEPASQEGASGRRPRGRSGRAAADAACRCRRPERDGRRGAALGEARRETAREKREAWRWCCEEVRRWESYGRAAESCGARWGMRLRALVFGEVGVGCCVGVGPPSCHII